MELYLKGAIIFVKKRDRQIIAIYKEWIEKIMHNLRDKGYGGCALSVESLDC